MSQLSSGEENVEERPQKRIKPSESSEDKSIQEQVVMSKLFNKVLLFLQKNFGLVDDSIAISISDIIEKFISFDYFSINYSKPENLCGYFYRYGLLNTSLARSRFLDAMQNSDQLKKKLRKSEINVISLGGGPGTDVLGFCSALYENSIPHKRVHFAIVDMAKRWGSFYNMLEFFIKEGNYGNCSGLFELYTVSSTFMCVDLTEVMPPKRYLMTLKLADIVLLSRVLDVYNRNDDTPLFIMKRIVQRMKKGALLLLIDSHAEHWKLRGLKKIYLSDLPEFKLDVAMKDRYSHKCALKSKAEIAVFEKI